MRKFGAVADPDLQVRGGGGGHPDPEIMGGGGGLQTNFFSALRASVWSKNKGMPGPPGPPGPFPWIRPRGVQSRSNH